MPITRKIVITTIIINLLLKENDCDGKEDFNDFFNLFSVDVRSLSDIPASPKCHNCPRVYYPICADDNITYINECRMRCVNENKNKKHKAKMLRTGPCQVFPDFK